MFICLVPTICSPVRIKATAKTLLGAINKSINLVMFASKLYICIGLENGRSSTATPDLFFSGANRKNRSLVVVLGFEIRDRDEKKIFLSDFRSVRKNNKL